jgi:hypothetical protein
MTNTSEALFVIKLPAGAKTVEYKEIPYLIALAKTQALEPGFDPESDDTLTVHMKEVDCQKDVQRAAEARELEVLNSFTLRPLAHPIGEILKNGVVHVSELRRFIEGMYGAVEVAPALPVVTTIKPKSKKANEKDLTGSPSVTLTDEAVQPQRISQPDDEGADTTSPEKMGKSDEPSTPKAPIAIEPAAAPHSRQQEQERVILMWLKENNHDPLRLKKWRYDASGVKAEARNAMLRNPQLFTHKSFDLAWERLRKQKKIQDDQ